MRRTPLAELVRLRWLAIALQGATAIAVTWVWNVALPLAALASLLAATALSNIPLARLAPRAPDSWVGPVLLLDVATLTALLALTGGPANPFSVLFLIQVMLAAMMTTTLWTWTLVFVSSAGFGLLFFVHRPLPPELGGHMHHGHSPYSAHLQAMWVAYTVTAITIGTFVSRLAQTLRAAREERARAARLLGLATLAAGAAHEIGNPLATIRVAASELEEQLSSAGAGEDVITDLRLINAEVGRAHAVLGRLAAGAGELVGESPTPLALESWLAQLPDALGPGADRVDLAPVGVLPVVQWPVQATLQALQQLLRNALDASPHDARVQCEVRSQGHGVSFRVRDRGKGMPRDVLERLGEPFFTTRAGEGMGLGVFIARSLIEHLGGRMQFESVEGRGTTVSVWLPARVTR